MGFRETIPAEQYERVLSSDMCDIGGEFLGFTDVYEHLAAVIPTHWSVVDLGCAYAPQAFIFAGHKRYVGVDMLTPIAARFMADNTDHYHCSISEFIEEHLEGYEQDTTFAVCSYVPPWRDDNMLLARRSFKNVFTYYPAGGPDIVAEVLCKHSKRPAGD